MKKITIVNKELIYYKEDAEADMFIEQMSMNGEWGLPDEIEINIIDWKSRQKIMDEIFSGCEDQTQQMRLVNALDKKSSFSTALDNDNYDLARYKMQESYGEGLITESDLNFVNSIIPTGDIE